MKRLRNLVPVFGVLALVALFFKLPETPSLLGIFECKACVSDHPYWALLGAGYFAMIIALALLFPALPTPPWARVGFIWAVLFAAALTYSNLPNWCVACVFAHGCNILIWLIWMLIPGHKGSVANRRERLFSVLLAPIAVVALFSGINLTFMAYDVPDGQVAATHLEVGDAIPTFNIQTINGRVVSNSESQPLKGVILNFVSIDCSHCKEQMQILTASAAQVSEFYKIINVSPKLPVDLSHYSPAMEWVEDRKGELGELFGVAAYPTLFMIGEEGKVVRVIPGVPEQLQADLITKP